MQPLQSISIPLYMYKQAATGSQEFQGPCTWSMQNNSVFTVQPLQSISIPLHVYKQAATGSQEFQDTCTWFMQNNSVFTVQPLQSMSIPLHVYTNKLQQVLRSSKVSAHGPRKTILSLLCMHYNLYLCIPLHVYKQAATSSQEFQDTSTWFILNNSVFTVQALYNLYLFLYICTNKLQQVLRNSKIPPHGSC